MRHATVSASVIINSTVRFLAKIFGLYLLIYLNYPTHQILVYTAVVAMSEVYSIIAAYLAIKNPKYGVVTFSIVSVLDAISVVWLVTMLGLQNGIVPFYGFIVVLVAALNGGLWSCIMAGLAMVLSLAVASASTGGINATLLVQAPVYLLIALLAGVVDHQRVYALRQKDELLERSTRQKEVNRLKNEFIAIASHNMRTPVTVLKACLEVLMLDGKDKSDSAKEKEKLLRNMSDNVVKLNKLTDDFLNIASLEDEGYKLRTIKANILKAVEAAIKNNRFHADHKNIKIELLAPTEALPEIDIDSERITEAIGNIVGNAIKFSPDGGTVTVICKKDGPDVVISVQDRGVGIAKAEQDSLFQKFHRGTSTLTYDYEGVGLGLYIAKLVVEAHSGKIWFTSAENEGSTFYISLPMSTVGKLLESL